MQVKVGDFGLVTAMAESPVEMWVSVGEELDGWGDGRHTARVGTQLYMSPEQVSVVSIVIYFTVFLVHLQSYFIIYVFFFSKK